MRDVTTGQLYRGVRGAVTGLTVVIGADMAQVRTGAYLPAASGFDVRGQQSCARVGIHWQPGPHTSVFYGLTWLSPEFAGPQEGQVLGSLNLDFSF